MSHFVAECVDAMISPAVVSLTASTHLPRTLATTDLFSSNGSSVVLFIPGDKYLTINIDPEQRVTYIAFTVSADVQYITASFRLHNIEKVGFARRVVHFNHEKFRHTLFSFIYYW